MSHSLAGKRIVNTRALHQAGDLDTLLQQRGAIPLSYPCIAIIPPEDTVPLDSAIQSAATGAFDWMVLTSANTVLSLAQRLEALGLSLQNIANFFVAAVGTSTAQAAKQHLGLDVDLIPDKFTASLLATTFKKACGLRIFLPESDIARSTVAEIVEGYGASVTCVTAYRTITGSGGVDISSQLASGQVDAIVFTSSSTVENFLRRLAAEGGDRNHLYGICIACIGPQTAQTAQECGLTVSLVPATHTLEALVLEMETYFESVRTGAQ